MSFVAKPFTVNISRVIRLLGSRLYKTSDVVIRELAQNGRDAIHKRWGPSAIPKGRVQFDVNPASGTLSVGDNGVGMTEYDLEIYLSRLGESLKAIEDDLSRGSSLGLSDKTSKAIGEYGLGFFSSFMIADEVTVTTLVENASSAYRWHSVGTDSYAIERIDSTGISVGTTVVLRLHSGSLKYSNTTAVRDIIKHYCEYLDCPIYLNHSTDPVNCMVFPWEQKTEAKMRSILAERYGTPIDLAGFGVKKLPSIGDIGYALMCHGADETTFSIFCQRLFVTDILHIMPQDLKYIGGMVNYDGLTLSLGREVTVQPC